MKKKFLSLMMAAAVVATTSVSAFAADKTITGEDTKEQTTDITITGDIADEYDHIKPGTFNVTVPTTATFAVNKSGDFTGADLKVTNNGTQKIDVYAENFVDTNDNVGIQVLPKRDVTTDQTNTERFKVALRMRGNQGTAYFKTADAKSGVFKDENLENYADDEVKGVKVSSISPSNADTLNLRGDAGKKVGSVTTPIQDTFTLTLRIEKAQ